MLILAYFVTKNELYGQNDHSIANPLVYLKFLQNVRKQIMNRFWDHCKKLQKKGKKGQKRGAQIRILAFLFNIFIIFGPFLLILSQIFF